MQNMTYRESAFKVGTIWTATTTSKRAGADGPDCFIDVDSANALLANPAAAERRAREILEINASDPIALFTLGAALHRQGRNESAKAILEPLSQAQPQLGCALRELGFALRKLGDRESARVALLKALDLNYLDEDVLFALGDPPVFDDLRTGEEETPEPFDAPSEAAENALRRALDVSPNDARAMKRLADMLVRAGRWSDSEPLYRRCLEIAPDLRAARFRYATMLLARRKFDDARVHIERLLATGTTFWLLRALKYISLIGSGQADAAIAEFESWIENCTDKPGLWLEYARALHSKRDSRAADAIKRAIGILPSMVEAYVLYAIIKPFVWDQTMIDQVLAQLTRTDLAAKDRAQLHFALGKAYEDLGRYAESFENYRACNEILRHGNESAAEVSTKFVRRTMAVFNPMLLRSRAGRGCQARDPIFIVGMKRSGSTLVEQILSRHSAIEALGELEDLIAVVGRLAGYPQALKDIGPDRLRALGEEYMALTAPRRKLGKPFFTDKLPHNFGRVGLIHLILPNARIIDVRRHPLDCGLSNYKHLFRGARLSLSLDDLGSSYVDYVRLMAYFDKVLPGKVHRLIYERLIDDFEHEVKRLLNYLGLPFEEECLRFYEGTRDVETPSADQVRRPLYASGAGYWRHYEPWLGPMKEKLGYVLDCYPDVPKFFDEVHVRLRRPLSLGEAGSPFASVRGLRQARIAAG